MSLWLLNSHPSQIHLDVSVRHKTNNTPSSAVLGGNSSSELSCEVFTGNSEGSGAPFSKNESSGGNSKGDFDKGELAKCINWFLVQTSFVPSRVLVYGCLSFTSRSHRPHVLP